MIIINITKFNILLSNSRWRKHRELFFQRMKGRLRKMVGKGVYELISISDMLQVKKALDNPIMNKVLVNFNMFRIYMYDRISNKHFSTHIVTV